MRGLILAVTVLMVFAATLLFLATTASPQAWIQRAPVELRLSPYANPVNAVGTVTRETSGADKLAFAGALGHGRLQPVPSSPTIYKVTNKNNSGTGSLRACLEATGDRICLFTQGGTWSLDTEVVTGSGWLRVAGESAPLDSGGVQIRLSPTHSTGARMIRHTGSGVWRHVKLRRGPVDLAYRPAGSCCADNFEISGSKVVLAHVSAQFSTDENVSSFGGSNFTVQDSLIAWSLHISTSDATVTTPGTGHSKGFLIDVTSGAFTMWRNLTGGYEARAPRVQNGTCDASYNLIYGVTQAEMVTSGTATCNFIGNVVSHPTNATGLTNRVIQTSDTSCVYASGNTIPAGMPLYQTGACSAGSAYTRPPLPAGITAVGVERTAGAWPRDSLDASFVSHYLAGTLPGGADNLIDTPSEVGGWPAIAEGTAWTDSDADGVPDEFETAFYGGLAQTASSDTDGDGWTLLEEWLEYMHRRKLGSVVAAPAGDNVPDGVAALDTGWLANGLTRTVGSTGANPEHVTLTETTANSKHEIYRNGQAGWGTGNRRIRLYYRLQGTMPSHVGLYAGDGTHGLAAVISTSTNTVTASSGSGGATLTAATVTDLSNGDYMLEITGNFASAASADWSTVWFKIANGTTTSNDVYAGSTSRSFVVRRFDNDAV